MILKVLAISEINLILKFVNVDTLIEQRVDIAEEIVEFVHAVLISGVYEFSMSRFGADSADVGVSCALLAEALHAEEAVAVEYEFACLLEAGLAFVTVLRVLVHVENTNFSLIKLKANFSYIKINTNFSQRKSNNRLNFLLLKLLHIFSLTLKYIHIDNFYR